MCVTYNCAKGLLSRKLLPHELEEKEAKINALGLEQIHNQTLARSVSVNYWSKFPPLHIR